MMNREIKFRAFNTKKNKIISDEKLIEKNIFWNSEKQKFVELFLWKNSIQERSLKLTKSWLRTTENITKKWSADGYKPQLIILLALDLLSALNVMNIS